MTKKKEEKTIFFAYLYNTAEPARSPHLYQTSKRWGRFHGRTTTAPKKSLPRPRSRWKRCQPRSASTRLPWQRPPWQSLGFRRRIRWRYGGSKRCAAWSRAPLTWRRSTDRYSPRARARFGCTFPPGCPALPRWSENTSHTLACRRRKTPARCEGAPVRSSSAAPWAACRPTSLPYRLSRLSELRCHQPSRIQTLPAAEQIVLRSAADTAPAATGFSATRALRRTVISSALDYRLHGFFFFHAKPQVVKSSLSGRVHARLDAMHVKRGTNEGFGAFWSPGECRRFVFMPR